MLALGKGRLAGGSFLASAAARAKGSAPLFSLSMTSLFIAQAAGGAGSSGGGFFGGPLPMILLMVIMMFVMFRSQSKRQREMEAMQKALKVGDEVVTAGGLHGTVTSLREKTVILKVAENVKLEFDKQAVATVKKKSDVIEA
jgi:preprotein translocase subunit YajC